MYAVWTAAFVVSFSPPYHNQIKRNKKMVRNGPNSASVGEEQKHIIFVAPELNQRNKKCVWSKPSSAHAGEKWKILKIHRKMEIRMKNWREETFLPLILVYRYRYACCIRKILVYRYRREKMYVRCNGRKFNGLLWHGLKYKSVFN